MRKLESDGYKNVTGLKREFAIELKDYESKENLRKLSSSMPLMQSKRNN